MKENFKCEECNSPLVMTGSGKRFNLECSYCGVVVESGQIFDGFTSELVEDEKQIKDM